MPDNNAFGPKPKIVNLGGTIEGFPQVPNIDFTLGEGSNKGPTPSVTDLYLQAAYAGGEPKGVPSIPSSSIYVGERYPFVRPGEDLEEMYGQQQSSLDKWKNGAIKMAGTAAASFVSGTAGLIYGIGDVFKTGKFSSLYNNDMTRKMDETFIQKLEDIAPNYYTAKEKDADWWSPDNIWTANFFSDKLMKNLGYTVGALGGGMAWTKLLKTLGTTNALVRAGYGLEAVTAAEEAMNAVPKVNQFAAFDGAVNSVAQKYLKTPLAKILNEPDRIIASTMGTFGEASLEALQNANEFRKTAIEQYVKKYGKNPTGADLEEIDDYVSNVGNFTWGMNTLLLTGTNYIQLPKILGSSNRADKMLLNQIEKKGQGAAFTEVVPSTKFGRVLQRSKDVSKLFFAPTEAFEEGAQFAIQVGTNDYFNRAFRNRQGTQDFLTALSGTMGNVLGKGVEDAISTKEGLESILIGGLSGGIQQARGTIKEQGILGTGGIRRANTDVALGALNQTNIENVLGDYARYIGIGIGSQKARQQAIVNNDKVSEKDFETDFTLSYIMPRVKYGKVDSIGEELSYYSQQASIEEGFQQLVANGIVNAGETREDFLARLTNITRITKNIDDLYDSLGRKYGNQPGYTSEILDKMVYSLAKVGSYDLRIPEVNNLLFTAGVNTQDILQSIIKENKPNKEAVEQSLAQINEMDVTSETKDDLKTALSDIIELGLRRKLFIDEYDAIKAKPEDFQFKPDVEFGATEELPVTVIEGEEQPVTEEGQIELFPVEKERKLEVGKEYFLRQPVRKEDNTLTLAPKIKVLSQTLGGEFEVQLPKGNVSFLTPEQFKTLDLAEEGTESPELRDIMEAAIDNVLAKPEFADITIPENELDKLGYVNSLNNATLIDAIEDEFNGLAEDYLKEQADLQANREKMNEVADKIKSAQTDLAATSGVVPTGNNEQDLMNTPKETLKETPKKDASILFTSSTSASVDWEKTLAPNITRYNEFINKVKTFKNSKNIKAIVVTQKQEAALGLAGLGELSFREGNFDTSLLNDPIEGFIGLVFVEDKKGERQFVDKNGNPIGKVGEQVELNKVVFTSMPAAKLTNSKGEPRNRAGQEEQAALELAAYEAYRKDLREAAEEEYPIFNFTVSKGIAITDDVKKSVGGVLIPENQIATQQVLTVVTKGGVDHIDGVTYNFPNGRPVFQSQDTLEYLNNSNLTKDQATAVYSVLKAMSTEAKQQIAAKKPVKFREIYKRFLQGVTFYTNADAVAKGVGEGSSNRVYIEGSILHIGDNTYDFANIEKQEVPIISDLQGVFHNVNSFAVNLGLGEPFVEFYVDNNKLQQRSWKNYQSYLLASKNPDGSGRIAPLTTTVAKPTEAVPYTHKQKYIILNGLELPKQSVAKPAEPEVETYKSNVGAITYKSSTDTKGNLIVELVGENPNIQKIVDSPELMAVATQQLKDLGKFDDLDTPVETAAKFAVEFITAKLVKDKAEVAPRVEVAPVVSDIEAKKADISNLFNINNQSVLDNRENIISNPSNYEFTKKIGNITIEQSVDVNQYKSITIIQRVLSNDKSISFANNIYVSPQGEVSSYVSRAGGISFFKDKSGVVNNQAKQKMLKLAETVKNYFPEIFNRLEKYAKQYKGLVISYDNFGEVVRKTEFLDAFDSFLYSKDLLSDADFVKITLHNTDLSALEGGKPEQTEQPKNINIGDAEYRRIGRTDVDRISDAELALFKEWHAKNARNIPYEVLENVININNTEKAWGAFENGVAKFFKGAQRGTEYHEIFEGIWKGFLSQGEQQAILDEFKAQTGTFLDRESGKRIDYADATDQQAKERIADDFAEFRLGKLPARNLTERIKNFFKAIMDFFKSFVTKPSLKEDLFKAIDTGEFVDRTLPETVKNQAAEYRKIQGLNAKQTNEFVQDITARVFGEIFANNRSLFNIEDITASELFNRIKEQYIKNNVIGDNPVTQITDNQYTNLVERTKEFLKTYRIEFDEDSRVTVNDEGANRKDYAAEAFTVNFKKSSPYAVKLLIGTLIKTKGLSQEAIVAGKRPDADKSSIGGLKLLSFSQAFTTLMSKLSNTRSIPEFVSKLHELAKENSDYVRLFERLGGNMKTGKIDFNAYQPHDIRLFTNFYQVFTKQRPDALAMFMDGNNVYTAPANQASAIAATRSEWIENMKTKAEQPGSIINYDEKKRVYTVKKEDYNIKTPQDKIEFLAQLGIEFPMSIYNKVKNKKAFSDAVSGIKTGLSKTDELMSFGGRNLGIRTQLNELAKLYTIAASPAEDSTYFGVDGNRIQSDTDSNYPSLLEYVFNSSDTLEELKQNMPQLNDVFSTNSQVLKLGGKFFDEEGNRIAEIKLQYIQGVKDVVDNAGQTTSALSIGDRYITEMNQNLDGRYYVLIPADSSREWMMDLGNTITYTDVAAGNTDKLFTDTFLGYLKDEIKLAQDSTNRAKLRNVGDKATELRFLKEMLPTTLLNKIQKLIDNRASEADINTFINTNREDLDAGILKSLNDTVTKTRQNLVETQKVIAGKEAGSFLMPELENRFTDKAGLNKFAMTDQEVNDVIKFANANYMINNVEFHKILFGDPYQFEIKGNQLDEIKRIKSFLSPRRITVNSDEFNNLFNKQYNTVAGVELTPEDYGYHEHKNFAKTFTAADVNVTDSFYPKSNEADAASWIMDAAYKEVKLKNGQWSDEAEDWHQWQMAYTRQNVPGYTYKSEALRKHDEKLVQQPEPKYVIDVLKPIVSGNKFGKTNFDLVLDKFSQMPLYYKAIKGTNLGRFYEKMFKEGYDYAVVVSGRKVGAEKLHKLYNEDGSFNEEAFNNTINVGWDAYGIQVENSYDKDSKQTLASQPTKLISVDLYSDGKPLNEDAKKKVEHNTEVLKEMILNGYQELLRKLSIEDLGDNFVVKDKTVVADTLRQEMLKREMSENGIDSISIDPETGEFYIPFEASTNYIQIKNILYSIVDKSIVSPKVNGFPAVQVPVTMWEKAGESRGEGLKKSALKFYSKEDPYMEVYLPAWFKKQLPQGKTDEELIKLLEGSEILKGIGFRIPTQGLNSVEVFKIKGFLPEFMGKTIVVPSEITTKAGSDFDIDKLNLYLKNIYVTPSGEIKSVPFFGYGEQAKEAIKKFILEEDIKAMLDINSDISGSREDDYGTLADKLYKQSLENEYFRSMEELLTLPENFDRLTSPNTDKTLKEIAGKLDELRNENEGDIKNRLLDRNYMTNQRHAFLTGKRWIGIAAVNITGNSLAQKTDVFVENPQTEMALPHNTFKDGGFDHISLSGMKDQAGEYISDKLSMYANAFVDISKDPYIMKIIYSNRVVGTFMLLERAGVPMETVAMFMNQPIVREHIKNLDANSAPRYAISNPDYIKQAQLQFPASPKAIQAATIAPDNFEDNISSFASKTMTEAQNAEQHKILNEFLSYVTLADENFNFTQAINYDTTTFRNADDFYRKELMTDRAQQKGAISSPKKVLDSSFLGTEKTVLDQSNSALGAILKFNQPEFRGVLENTIQQYAEKFYIAKDKFNRVAEKATASLLDYIIQTGRKNPLNISELSFGSESVAVKLEEAKQKYPNIQILQDLVVVSSERPNSPKTIKLRANLKEAYDENMYIGMMRELRDNPNTNQLYKDLIKAGIIQGTYQSAVSIKNILPIEDYSAEVKNIVNTAVVDVNVQEFAANNWFQRNNWKNADITPTIAPYIDEESVTEIGEFKNQTISQYKFTGFVEIPEIGVGDNDKLVLAVGEKSKAAGYDLVAIPRIITTKYGEMIDFMTGRTVTKSAYAEMKAKGDPMIGQMFGYQKVKFIDGTPLRTYKGKFVFKMVNLYGDGQFISEYHKFNRPSELENNTGKVTDEIPNSAIIKYFTGIEENEVSSQPETETDLTTKDFKCKF